MRNKVGKNEVVSIAREKNWNRSKQIPCLGCQKKTSLLQCGFNSLKRPLTQTLGMMMSIPLFMEWLTVGIVSVITSLKLGKAQ
jgi:hypothetical protein